VEIGVTTSIMKCYWFVVSGNLLYSQGFTISGARNRLDEGAVFEEAGSVDEANWP
jgi:hypothetical protein